MIQSDPKKHHVLAVVTDSARAEFVKQAEPGIDRKLLPADWRLKFVEAGTLSHPVRLALLRQAVLSGEYSAALYLHLLLTYDQADIFKKAKIPLCFLGGHLD